MFRHSQKKVKLHQSEKLLVSVKGRSSIKTGPLSAYESYTMYCSRITSSNPTLETTHQIAMLHPVHTFHSYITIDKNALAMRNRSRVSLILTVLSLPSVAARKIWQGKRESTRFTPRLSVQTACTDHKHKLQKIESSQGMSLNEGLNTGFLTYRAFPLWYY